MFSIFVLGILGLGALAAQFAMFFDRWVLGNDPQKSSSDLLLMRLDSNAALPTRNGDAAGLDVTSTIEVEVPARGLAKVPVGWAMRAPPECYLRVAERSGMASRDIGIGGGVIDRDYTGEVHVVLRNFTDSPIVVAHGAKVAQIIVTRIASPKLREVDELSDTQRGTSGFGSSDKMD